MRLVVVGFGQCGGRVADEFARLSIKARNTRGLNIVTGCYAVNTDIADLSGLHTIRANYDNRILIGSRKTGGHGVGKINELGAEIAREDSDKVIETIRNAKYFPETDAFLLVAIAAGGGCLLVIIAIVVALLIGGLSLSLLTLPLMDMQ